MAVITTLHWNIETYGPGKWANGNNVHMVNYIATLADHVDADIICLVEIKNSIAGLLPGMLATDINAIQGIAAANNPWRSVHINSGFNSECSMIMYRTDRNFLPYHLVNGTGANVVPEHGPCMNDVAGNRIQFPSRMTAQGGRRPFYATFETTDTNNIFSVITYHAMYGAATPLGVNRLPSVDIITQFDDGPPPTAIPSSLISGDFNVDYILYPGDYANMLALPSTDAVNEDTSLRNNPGPSNDPTTFRESAYDNVFQVTPVAANAGAVTDLMVESAVVPAVPAPPPPPAAQAHVGVLSAAAGAFVVANIGTRWIANAVAVVPPVNMDDAWSFVREAISNHYPVSVNTTI
jgi:hypothetical protein